MLTDHRRDGTRMAQEAARRRNTVREYGDYISALADWHLFMTISFRYTRAPASALDDVEAWLNALRRIDQGPTGWILAQARGDQGRLHIHALVAGLENADLRALSDDAVRRFGNCRIDLYDDSRGGAYYVAKNGLSDGGDFRFGGDLLPHQTASRSNDVDRTIKGQLLKLGDEDLDPPDDNVSKGQHKFTGIYIAVSDKQMPVQGFAWCDGESEHLQATNASADADAVALAYEATLAALEKCPDGSVVLVQSDVDEFTTQLNKRRRASKASHLRSLRKLTQLIKRKQVDVRVVGCLPERNLARKLLSKLKEAPLAARRPVGRPRCTDLDPVLIAALRRRGVSLRAIARGVGAGYGTVRRIEAARLARWDRKDKGAERRAGDQPR